MKYQLRVLLDDATTKSVFQWERVYTHTHTNTHINSVARETERRNISFEFEDAEKRVQLNLNSFEWKILADKYICMYLPPKKIFLSPTSCQIL